MKNKQFVSLKVGARKEDFAEQTCVGIPSAMKIWCSRKKVYSEIPCLMNERVALQHFHDCAHRRSLSLIQKDASTVQAR